MSRDAETETTDRGRRSWDNLLPLLFGLVMGLLTGFSVVNGRVTALETTVANLSTHGQSVDKTIDELRELKTTIAQLQASVDQLVQRRGGK